VHFKFKRPGFVEEETSLQSVVSTGNSPHEQNII